MAKAEFGFKPGANGAVEVEVTISEAVIGLSLVVVMDKAARDALYDVLAREKAKEKPAKKTTKAVAARKRSR